MTTARSLRRASGLIAGIVLVVAVAIVFGAVTAMAGKPGPVAPTPVKNVILIIGDGMGPEHTELGSLLYGPMAVNTLTWDATGWLDTSSLSGVTWSCAAATALATGYETSNGVVGMSPDASGQLVARKNALEAAEMRGKATGLLTDVYLPDATPAGFSAHVADRYMKDSVVSQQIARDIEVLFGAHAGRLAAYLDGATKQSGPVTVSSRLADLQPYLDGKTPWPQRLWGFYGTNSMVYDIDREEEGVVRKEPKLSQLTTAALNVLDKDPDGFFLLVEGGAIDWVSHYRDAAATALEVKEFNSAVSTAYAWAKAHPGTLLVVTSDHETGGLGVDPATVKTASLVKQTASTEWMWGLIKTGASISTTLKTHAGFTPTTAEVAHIKACGEPGIADVLSWRGGVTWGWSGSDEGDHTGAPVPVRAWGPSAGLFGHGSQSAPVDNETVGQALLQILAP
jgi:alkaline phosphatase